MEEQQATIAELKASSAKEAETLANQQKQIDPSHAVMLLNVVNPM